MLWWSLKSTFRDRCRRSELSYVDAQILWRRSALDMVAVVSSGGGGVL